MPTWKSQHYRTSGLAKGVLPQTIDRAIETAEALHRLSPLMPPVFSLRHLSELSEVPYSILRETVERENDPYRLFRIRKRPVPNEPLRYRIITVPSPPLKRVQSWIDREILNHALPDEASTAFSTKSSIFDAAALHCGARWLIKLDVKSFFESIDERQVYRVFLGFGYQPLVAFEMTRLCTRMPRTLGRSQRWYSSSDQWGQIPSYQSYRLGHLPQGAPSSPRLSNLAVIGLDQQIRAVAREAGLVYSRYADDLTLSTKDAKFTRKQATKIIGKIFRELGNYGFSPNLAKTHIASPGARKIVLGLGVDTDRPQLTREFKARMRQHLHYLAHPSYGPVRHASENGAGSVYALRNHVKGLLAFAKGIDAEYAARQTHLFNKIEWP